MTLYEETEEDVFGSSGSSLYPPSKRRPRKVSSKHSMNGLNGRRSSASLRVSSNLVQEETEDAANSRHSLAHELAFALMPEPNVGSKSLAAEFGIEYDEGAEGIDGQTQAPPQKDIQETDSLEDGHEEYDSSGSVEATDEELTPIKSRQPPRHQPEEDVFTILAKDMEITEQFLSNLRQLDVESSSSSSATVEKVAGDIIRRINESTRDRETQLRELSECDREFRKIVNEVGGNDVLGQVEELDVIVGLSDPPTKHVEAERPQNGYLQTVKEEPDHLRPNKNDWESDVNDRTLGDEDGLLEPSSPTTLKESAILPPRLNGPASVSKMLPHLTHLRTLTASLVSSLTVISDQSQVNGTASADAGRKIRALKNRLTGLKTEIDIAEKSRLKIERWEAGYDDFEYTTSTPPRRRGAGRIDGRILVKEHLKAFEAALVDAGSRTQAIMAAS